MSALKWWKQSTRMWFEGEAGGSEAPAAPASGGGDGGSAPAPAPSTPSPAAPDAPVEAGASPDWTNLGSVDDLDYHVEVAAEPTPPTPAEPPKEPVKPVPPPQPQPAQPQDPQPPPATAQTQPSATAPPALSASDPWRIAEGLEANRDAVIAHLAQAKFALSEDDIKELDTDVTVAVPRLLARVFLESQVSMQKFLAQAVPGMVKQYNTVTSANKSAEDAFFSAHRALDVNNPQHRATAVRIATVYRQANPDIPLNQLIQEVGPMVMAALRVNAPAQPSATPGRIAPRNAAGFVPAVNGGGGVSPQPDAGNPWDGLGRNFDEY